MISQKYQINIIKPGAMTEDKVVLMTAKQRNWNVNGIKSISNDKKHEWSCSDCKQLLRITEVTVIEATRRKTTAAGC